MKHTNYKHNQETQTVIIEINRPKQLNALNKEVIDDLHFDLNKAQKSKDVRSIILTGFGDKAFVAGADIKEFQNFNKDQAFNLSQTGKEKLFDRIANFNKPIIAAINGYALGGGLELALSAHIRVASKNAKMGLPECSLGLIPGYGGTQRLPRIIGLGIANEMILTGKMLSAEEAYRIGLINHVFNLEDLIPNTLSISKSFNTKSPESLSAAIKSINNCFNHNGDHAESLEFAKLFETQNFKEGVRAFMEKRKPNFNT